MNVLVTGATGYIGGRLIPRLVGKHDVTVLVRDKRRVEGRPWADKVQVCQGDMLAPESLPTEEFDVGYYLVHSMRQSKDFEDLDAQAARNFGNLRIGHCIYVGGLQPPDTASAHLRSRAETGEILAANLPTTEFQAGPVIGSGSASFEMIRYLTERLPVMVVPKWVGNVVQPIAIRDLLDYLESAIMVGPSGVVPIGSTPYKFGQMMQIYAEARGLPKRLMVPTPFLAPGLAARWVRFITPIPNTLAVPIIKGMSQDLTGDTGRAQELFPEIKPMDYEAAVGLAIDRIDGLGPETSWSDAQHRPGYELTDWENLLTEVRVVSTSKSVEEVYGKVAAVGGDNGWPSWPWAWRMRGAVDRMVGGPGLRRGRRHPTELRVGDAVDFWRVEVAEAPARLRLRAEMKIPGRAWLQFDISNVGGVTKLVQTALFEPKGLAGIVYWKSLYPVHRLLFKSMAEKLADGKTIRDGKS